MQIVLIAAMTFLILTLPALAIRPVRRWAVKRPVLTAFILMIVLALSLVNAFYKTVDKCLDNGGRWDWSSGGCDRGG